MATRSDRNIVITGFMGTGKTTVAQRLAGLVARPFIDTDAEIERRAGRSIAAIFAEDGEAAFRRSEARLCRFLAGQRGLVIATGGGTLVDPGNRAVMLASGFVVCLNASVETIRQRLTGQSARPLFHGDWEGLLRQRQAAYAEIPHQIDTDGRLPETIAEEVLALWREWAAVESM
ncbi:MAG: shikimate kinase [Aggregatilineales bacterium]